MASKRGWLVLAFLAALSAQARGAPRSSAPVEPALREMFASFSPGLGQGVLWYLEAPEPKPEILKNIMDLAAAGDSEFADAEAVHPESIRRLADAIESGGSSRADLPELAKRLYRMRTALEPHLSPDQRDRFEEVRLNVRNRLSGRQRAALGEIADAVAAEFGDENSPVEAAAPADEPGNVRPLRLASSRRKDDAVETVSGPTDLNFQLQAKRDNMPYRRPIAELAKEHPAAAHRLSAVLRGAGLTPEIKEYAWLDHAYDLTDARTLVNRRKDTLVILGPRFDSPFAVYSAGPVLLWDADVQGLVAGLGPVIVAGKSSPRDAVSGRPLLLERTADLSEAKAVEDGKILWFGRRPKTP